MLVPGKKEQIICTSYVFDQNFENTKKKTLHEAYMCVLQGL